MMQLRHLRTLLCAGVLAALAVPAHAQLTIDMTKPSFEPVRDDATHVSGFGALHLDAVSAALPGGSAAQSEAASTPAPAGRTS